MDLFTKRNTRDFLKSTDCRYMEASPDDRSLPPKRITCIANSICGASHIWTRLVFPQNFGRSTTHPTKSSINQTLNIPENLKPLRGQNSKGPCAAEAGTCLRRYAINLALNLSLGGCETPLVPPNPSVLSPSFATPSIFPLSPVSCITPSHFPTNLHGLFSFFGI
jgi:hypothetical protein